MTFTITAWGPDGRSVYRVNCPASPKRFVDHDADLWSANEDALLRLPNSKVARLTGRTVRAVKDRRHFLAKISSPEASLTAGRANPTLGNLLHADLCADPSEARW